MAFACAEVVWVFEWRSEKMGEAAKRQPPMEKTGVLRGPTQPYTVFRPRYLILRIGCPWPDSLHWEHDSIRQGGLYRRLLESDSVSKLLDKAPWVIN